MNHGERAQQERQHIFVINKSPELLDLVRDLLQEERFNVTTTNLLPETIHQIRGAQPALLIVDLAVGEEAGWALLQELRTNALVCHIPVIVLSTSPRLLAVVERDPERFGGQRFLRKPFDLEDLLEAVDALIGSA